MAKRTKQAVNYSKGMIQSHCGKVFGEDKGYCKHFRGIEETATRGECSKVEGSINPVFWCELFSKAVK